MLDNEIRYAETPDGNSFVPWSLVINQTECKAKRLVGEILQLVEMLGLSEKQEVAIKASIKTNIYKASNDSLDWMSYALEAKGEDGKLEKMPEDAITSLPPAKE